MVYCVRFHGNINTVLQSLIKFQLCFAYRIDVRIAFCAHAWPTTIQNETKIETDEQKWCPSNNGRMKEKGSGITCGTRVPTKLPFNRIYRISISHSVRSLSEKASLIDLQSFVFGSFANPHHEVNGRKLLDYVYFARREKNEFDKKKCQRWWTKRRPNGNSVRCQQVNFVSQSKIINNCK